MGDSSQIEFGHSEPRFDFHLQEVTGVEKVEVELTRVTAKKKVTEKQGKELAEVSLRKMEQGMNLMKSTKLDRSSAPIN